MRLKKTERHDSKHHRHYRRKYRRKHLFFTPNPKDGGKRILVLFFKCVWLHTDRVLSYVQLESGFFRHRIFLDNHQPVRYLPVA